MNYESEYFSQELPWSSIGEDIQEAINIEDALTLSNLDWEVKQTNALVSLNNEQPQKTDFMINYRDSDNTILGIVKEQYKIVQNADAFEFVDKIIESEAIELVSAGTLLDGKIVWLASKMKPIEVLNEKIIPHMIFTNSHDGSSAIRCTVANVKASSKNTLNLNVSEAKRTWSFVHKGNMKFKLEEANSTLMNAQKYQIAFKKEMERLAKIKYTTKDLRTIIDKLFPINNEISLRRLRNAEYIRSGFIYAMNKNDIRQYRNTAYGILQAVSDFVYHLKPLRVTENYKEKRFKQVLDGSVLLDKAYALVARK